MKLEDDVPEPEKSERLSRLFALSDGMRQRHLATRVGEVEAVLVEEFAEGGRARGRSARNEIVHFSAARDLRGELVSVRVTRANKNSLEAEPIEPSLRSASASSKRPEGQRALPVLS
jgi:tRNA A37 methylthiotransferase MiaB